MASPGKILGFHTGAFIPHTIGSVLCLLHFQLFTRNLQHLSLINIIAPSFSCRALPWLFRKLLLPSISPSTLPLELQLPAHSTLSLPENRFSFLIRERVLSCLWPFRYNAERLNRLLLPPSLHRAKAVRRQRGGWVCLNLNLNLKLE